MTKFAYTDEQQQVLQARDVPVAIDAGAGCGKTFVLTERYLSHLEPSAEDQPPAKIEQLVAITFTEAAAREMRDRIRARCRERLAQASGESGEFWRSLFRSLDAARVSTIHSFAASLIHDNAVELGVDPTFSVLDPAESYTLLSAAVDDTLRARLTRRRGELDEDLIAAAAELDLSQLRGHVRQLATQAHLPGFGDWRHRGIDDQIEAWLKFYRQQIAPRYAQELAQTPEMQRLHNLLDQASPTKPGFADRVDSLREAINLLTCDSHPDGAIKRLQPLLYFRDPETRKDVCGVKDWPDAEMKKEFSATLKTLRDRLDRQRRAGDAASMRRAAELGRHVHLLAMEADQRYRQTKRARSVLDNDDLLVEAHRLLTEETFTEARRRVSEGIRVLLVDEFQDTDRLQADLVTALGEACSTFVVGDYKQSIYRFRGAVPKVFLERRASTPAGGQLTLSRNFRSSPAVIDFVNVTFAPIFGADYTPLRAMRPQLIEGPAVELLWTPKNEESSGVASERHEEAASIAGRLRQLIDSDEPLVVDRDGTPRGVTPGDIAILFRALSDVAIYEQALREAGLDYYLVGGHAFYAQQEVYDVLNLLRSILSESDEIALVGVLRSPLFGLSDESLFWLARAGSLSAGLFSAQLPGELTIEVARQVQHARDVLQRLRIEKDRISASALLDLAWGLTGYDAVLLAEFLGERKLANLEKLHEQARQADSAGSGLHGLAARLSEFVNQPPKEALAATTAEDAGVVRLMTVHASKGLEFPVVVLPDLNRPVQNQTSQAVYDPQLGALIQPPASAEESKNRPPVGIDFWKARERWEEEEERDRLFYVACTRAADRLILSSCVDPSGSLQGPWLRRLAERFDLTTGALLDGSVNRLTTVVPPTKAESIGHDRQSGKKALGEAIESARAKRTPGQPTPLEREVAFETKYLRTFSVTRLTGELLPQTRTLGTRGRNSHDPRRLGSLVHAVIELLDPAAESWESQIDELVDDLSGEHLRRGIEEGRAEAKRLVHSFVSSESWTEMCSALEMHREIEFLLPWPSSDAALRGYLDALYRDAEGWRIVDYKTNSLRAEDVPQIAQQYALQMAVYSQAVNAAFGEAPLSAYLVFLDPGMRHHVEINLEASASMIDQAIQDARQKFSG